MGQEKGFWDRKAPGTRNVFAERCVFGVAGILFLLVAASQFLAATRHPVISPNAEIEVRWNKGVALGGPITIGYLPMFQSWDATVIVRNTRMSAIPISLKTVGTPTVGECFNSVGMSVASLPPLDACVMKLSVAPQKSGAIYGEVIIDADSNLTHIPVSGWYGSSPYSSTPDPILPTSPELPSPPPAVQSKDIPFAPAPASESHKPPKQ